jgi:hypothetical protein
LPAIQSRRVPVDDAVVGLEWAVSDVDALAALIAVIALGQAEHASHIITELAPSIPAYTEADLVDDAKAQMGLSGTTPEQRAASRDRRDGFLFECMSWVVARQSGNARTFLKDPHLDSTSHGLDGLVLQLAPDEPEIVSATICEDKCTAHPRAKFRDEVLTTFGEHHRGGKRARDLVANAVELIRDSGARGTAAVKAAARVTDRSIRFYRAALTTTALVTETRARLFAGYSGLDGLGKEQRIGATFPLTVPLRDWFQTLAVAVIAALNAFERAEEIEEADDV